MKEYNVDTGTALPEVDPSCYAPDAQPLVITLESEFGRIPLRQITASRTNPRTTFNATKLQELADSIKVADVHQPILLRPLPGARVPDTDREVQYEIVAGERRFRAANMAGLDTIPAMVRNLTDSQVLEIQVVENLQRDDLTELEEAEGYERLMQHSTLTADAVGAKIGKSRSYAYARLKLLDLCPEARAVLRDGTIDASRALLLARLPDHKLQLKALEEVILQKTYSGEPSNSFRGASRIIQERYMLRLDKVSFAITDGTLVHGATACGACPKRTGHEPELFADVDSPDVCTDPDCYKQKEAAHQGRELQAAHERGQTVITGREAKALWSNSWGSVEGYLRLDDERDSPTGKSLRKLLAKPLEEGVKPVLIDNPYKPGELVAMLPSILVAELLGQQDNGDDQTASKKITKGLQDDEEIKKLRETTALKNEFEQGWRNELLKRTWKRLSIPLGGKDWLMSEAVLRHIALDFANRLNTEKAKFLCGLLELGKVAPVQALIDHITEHPEPEQMILLLVMHRDVEHQSWRADGGTNPGLMLVANDFQVDIDAVKADVKKGVKAKLKAEKKLSADPISPALHPKGGAGGKASTARPAAPARKPKLSAAEAQLGIAEAMQQMGGGQAAAAGSCLQDDHACAAPAPQDEGQAATKRILGTLKLPSRPKSAIAVGQRVHFKQGLKGPSGRLRKVCGRSGTVQEVNGEQYTVMDDSGGKHFAAASELEADMHAAPVQGALPVGVAIGQQVRVLANVRPVQEKFVNLQGKVIKKIGDGAWAVQLKGSKGKPGGVVCFDVAELEVV